MGEVDFDYEDGRMVYELEFYAGGREYEYDVDASTGAIVKSSYEGGRAPSQAPSGQGSSSAGSGSNASSGSSGSAGQDSGSAASTAPSTAGDIGADAARSAAYQHAGVTASQVNDVVVERDYDDGRLEYSVEFWAGTVEYDYEIDGSTGAVLKSQRETHASAATDTIGTAQAQSIALDAAGLTASDVRELEVSPELDERTPHYEVSFKSGGMEYEYKIDTATGQILSSERDRD